MDREDTENHREMDYLYSDLTGKIIGCAIEVHKILGPGLLDCGYRIDILVENLVVIELKTADEFNPIHESQILTYLKFSEKKIGLLMNFNVTVFKNGLKRYIR